MVCNRHINVANLDNINNNNGQLYVHQLQRFLTFAVNQYDSGGEWWMTTVGGWVERAHKARLEAPAAPRRSNRRQHEQKVCGANEWCPAIAHVTAHTSKATVTIHHSPVFQIFTLFNTSNLVRQV